MRLRPDIGFDILAAVYVPHPYQGTHLPEHTMVLKGLRVQRCPRQLQMSLVPDILHAYGCDHDNLWHMAAQDSPSLSVSSSIIWRKQEQQQQWYRNAL